MKKKLILLAGSLLAIAAVATTVVATNSNDDMSLLAQNTEALARYEIPPVSITCSRGGCGDCYEFDYDGFIKTCYYKGNPKWYCTCN